MASDLTFSERLHTWGWHRAVTALCIGLLRRLIGLRLCRVEISPARLDLMTSPLLPQGYTLALVDCADLTQHTTLADSLPPEFLENAASRGDRCCAAFFNSEPVACRFETRERTSLTDQLDIVVPQDFRFTYKTWSHPDHQDRSLQDACAYLLDQFGFRNEWMVRTVSFVDVDDYESRLHEYVYPVHWRQHTGYIGWVSLFGRQFLFNTRWAKRTGLVLRRHDDFTKHYFEG